MKSGRLLLGLVPARRAEHRGQDGEAERTAHLLRRVEQPGRRARLVLRDPGDRGQCQGHEVQAHAEAEQQHRAEHPAHVRAVRG